MHTLLRSSRGFTLVELIVGMLIFAIGMTGIFALINSTLGNARVVQDEVVVANLLREQVELIRNVRDTNQKNFVPFSKMLTGTFQVENRFDKEKFAYTAPKYEYPVALSGIILNTSSSSETFTQNRLYLDEYGRFTHTPTATGTTYASYVKITDTIPAGVGLIVKDTNFQALFIDARVLVKNANQYREYDLKTLVADLQ